MDNRMKYFHEEVGCDYILEVYEGKDFIEIVSKTGGDVTTTRIYGERDGKPETFMATER